MANTIYQHRCGRGSFTPTGDGRWGDASAPPSYSLLGYAERLETIGATLKMVRERISGPAGLELGSHDIKSTADDAGTRA
ncbi:hypothetical protein MMUR_00660 [Mycolicibacterium murale]|uniref:Uncharacterized protein n=1 Tax=Mycolicibacterium murale TaxID=182220 RepID=A0A7I9WF15_9MYCO|nr:hypothetical protein [Mycolicibacterium murale]GFG55930.1 hypothetical protein MMUR_00660 [Mycolicibacterium murale]